MSSLLIKWIINSILLVLGLISNTMGFVLFRCQSNALNLVDRKNYQSLFMMNMVYILYNKIDFILFSFKFDLMLLSTWSCKVNNFLNN